MIKVKINKTDNKNNGKKRVHTGIPVCNLICDETLAKLNSLKHKLMPKKKPGEKKRRVFSSKKKTMHFAPGKEPTITMA